MQRSIFHRFTTSINNKYCRPFAILYIYYLHTLWFCFAYIFFPSNDSNILTLTVYIGTYFQPTLHTGIRRVCVQTYRHNARTTHVITGCRALGDLCVPVCLFFFPFQNKRPPNAFAAVDDRIIIISVTFERRARGCVLLEISQQINSNCSPIGQVTLIPVRTYIIHVGIIRRYVPVCVVRTPMGIRYIMYYMFCACTVPLFVISFRFQK